MWGVSLRAAGTLVVGILVFRILARVLAPLMNYGIPQDTMLWTTFNTIRQYGDFALLLSVVAMFLVAALVQNRAPV